MGNVSRETQFSTAQVFSHDLFVVSSVDLGADLVAIAYNNMLNVALTTTTELHMLRQDNPKQSEALLDRLAKAQNHPENSMVDIMTITGFMKTIEELTTHVEHYEEQAQG